MVERTPKPKHIQIGLGLGLAGLVVSGPILANIAQAPDWSALGDVHLDVVPRTEDEAARIAAVLAPPLDFSEPQRFEVNSGGATTVRPANLGQAFMQPAANLSAMEGLEVPAGAAVFDRIWISAPSGNIASDGLGPLYNSRACVACHVMNGRGHPPAGPDDDAVSFALRLSVPADRARASAIPWSTSSEWAAASACAASSSASAAYLASTAATSAPAAVASATSRARAASSAALAPPERCHLP